MLSKERRINYDLNPIVRGMIAFYFFFSFFEPYVNGTVGAITKYYIIVLIGAILVSVKGVALKYYHYLYLAWFTYKMLSIFWSTNTFSFELHLLSQVGMMGLLLCLTIIPLDTKTVKWSINASWLGSTVIGVLSLFFSRPYKGELEARLVLNLFGVEIDPNNHAVFLITGVAISIYYILQLKQHKIISIAVILINSYALMMTASRGGLFGLIAVVVAALYIYTRKERFSKKIAFFFAFLIMVTVVLLIGNYFLLSDTFERLFDFSSYGDGSLRIGIWENTMSMIKDGFDLLFGVGWGSYYGYNEMYVAVHNTFLSIMTDTGLIGLIIFMLPIADAAFYLIRKRDTVAIGMFLAGMIPAVFMEAINKRFFWNSLIFLLMAYNYCQRNWHKDECVIGQK